MAYEDISYHPEDHGYIYDRQIGNWSKIDKSANGRYDVDMYDRQTGIIPQAELLGKRSLEDSLVYWERQ